MRSPTEAGLAPWPMRILRPWLVATASGLAIGVSLLRFDSPEHPGSYAESTPRAAVQDAPLLHPAPVPDASTEVPAPPAESEEALFAPAAPIAAFTDDLAPAPDPAPDTNHP